MSKLSTFVNAWIGETWSTSFDCWDFVTTAYREVYGLDLPTFPDVDPTNEAHCQSAFESESSGDLWMAVGEHPWHDGDVVVMGRTRHPVHCGIWMEADGGTVAHCDRRLGVVAHDLRRLRLCGWSHFSIFRHRGLA